MLNLTPEEIIDEIDKRKERFKFLRYLSWVFAIIFFFVIADIFFLNTLNLQDYGDFNTPINVMLFFAYVWGNLYFIYDFLTDKMENLSNVPLISKLGFVGWNIVCLGHLFGFINT